MQSYVEDAKLWMTQNNLQLNEGKIGALLVDHQNSPNLPISVKISQNEICFFEISPELGVIFDEKLSMKQHVSKTCQSSYPELRRISSIRHVPTVDATKPLWHPWFCHALITVTHCCQEFLNSWLTNFQGFKIVLPDSFSKLPNAHIFHHFWLS